MKLHALAAFTAGLLAGRARFVAVTSVAGAALVLTIGTVIVDRTVESRQQLAAVGFGYPVAFVTADLRRWTPPSFPRAMGWNPWEDPADFRVGRFLASYALVLAATALAAVAGVVAVRRVG